MNDYKTIYTIPEWIDMCDCGLTGGCEKCNSYKLNWEDEMETDK